MFRAFVRSVYENFELKIFLVSNWLSRSVCALPFVEKNKLEATLDLLRELPLNKEASEKDYERMRKFQEEFCDYIQDTWIRSVLHTCPEHYFIFKSGPSALINEFQLLDHIFIILNSAEVTIPRTGTCLGDQRTSPTTSVRASTARSSSCLFPHILISTSFSTHWLGSWWRLSRNILKCWYV